MFITKDIRTLSGTVPAKEGLTVNLDNYKYTAPAPQSNAPFKEAQVTLLGRIWWPTEQTVKLGFNSIRGGFAKYKNYNFSIKTIVIAQGVFLLATFIVLEFLQLIILIALKYPTGYPQWSRMSTIVVGIGIKQRN